MWGGLGGAGRAVGEAALRKAYCSAQHVCPLPACLRPHLVPLQRLVHTGLVPAMYRYQALAKLLKRSHDAEDDDDTPLEDQA